MSTESNIASKQDLIVKHFARFFPSLKHFYHKYSFMFTDPENPPEHAIYICPICLKNFIVAERSLGLAWTVEFTQDHFPPESVGGFQKILVCKPCNNDAGSEYDFSLKQKMESLSFEKKIVSSSLRVKSKISNVPGVYVSTFKIDEQGELQISLKPNEKSHVPLLDEWLKTSHKNPDWTAQITIPVPDADKISRALVKAAYLFCFDYWGYDFVYSSTGEMMRKYLNGECEYPVKVPFQWLGESVQASKVQHFPLGLCYLQHPVDCRSFVVNMVLRNKETGYNEIASVLIPSPVETGWEDLKKLQTHFESKYQDKVDLSMAHVTEFNINEKVYDGYQRSWDKLNAL